VQPDEHEALDRQDRGSQDRQRRLPMERDERPSPGSRANLRLILASSFCLQSHLGLS
jgi:hypothetical protein